MKYITFLIRKKTKMRKRKFFFLHATHRMPGIKKTYIFYIIFLNNSLHIRVHELFRIR